MRGMDLVRRAARPKVELVLFILIPVAWLTVLTLVLAACRMAARADAAPGRVANAHARQVRDEPDLWTAPPALALEVSHRLTPTLTPPRSRRPLEDRPLRLARPPVRRRSPRPLAHR
jgi:hypothetical protein